ncbi:hypothetical protein [Synoicihabitans lomoniglobus]|uniref:Uncharacterized protein n=1 Tax=Synoicihabitans lomoniglobus TaxID=2909285 RepID=A0AAF0CQA2_9BACT|nr:hypothetical protein [Opitutaceae bacterium LMO-M01]WED66067.1 hypothetical protein PXH66_04300 [Opitutaceae bacterium LMO-M01]
MPKIDVNHVAEILKRNEVDPKLLNQIVSEINAVLEQEAGEEKPPPIKKQWCILVSDPEGKLPEGEDFVGWVVQIPEGESPASTQERIHRAAYDFNATKRGQLLPATSMGEAIENVAAKHFKEAGLWVKTKEPVLILRTNNKIPTEKTEKDASWNRT